MISDLLGVPEADRPLLRPWSAQICGMYEVDPAPDAGRVASRAATEFSEYLRGLSRARRARPGRRPDHRPHPGGRRRRPAHRGRAHRHRGPAAQRRPRGHRQLHRHRLVAAVPPPRPAGPAPPATRPCCPGRSTSCCATTPPCRCSSAGCWRTWRSPGSRCPRGPSWGCCSARPTATRRPSRTPTASTWPAPRPPSTSASGPAIHYCLGAPLGRLELELSFGTLLRRLPAMAPAAEPAWKPTYILRGLEALHVTA